MHKQMAIFKVCERTVPQPVKNLWRVMRLEHFGQGVAFARAPRACSHGKQM